ncbi:hypothetical protein ACFFUB_07710 [Algimonas porphyrae]|nr:hypothetical protein [Algimonas porphyrae]
MTRSFIARGDKEFAMSRIRSALWKGRAELTLVGLVMLIGAAA